MAPDLFDGYERGPFFDEVFDAEGGVRTHYRSLADRLRGLTPDDLESRERLRDSIFRSRGITFAVYGEAQGIEREPNGDHVAVKTHAWVEVAIPGAGWWGLDPTNRQEVGERHVKIGHGRDYDDVLPLRGVYQGLGAHALDVAVRIRRESAAQQQ